MMIGKRETPRRNVARVVSIIDAWYQRKKRKDEKACNEEQQELEQ
jgi:hypothetical protein